MWSFVPRVYIASVEGYTERQERVRKNLHSLGIPPEKVEWNIVPRLHRGTLGMSTTDNHLMVYRRALAAGYPFVLIFEDDFYCSTNDMGVVREQIGKVERFVSNTTPAQQPPFDILYLGHFLFSLNKRPRPDCEPGIFQCRAACLHAYMISRACMKSMAKFTAEEIYESNMRRPLLKIPGMRKILREPTIDLFICWQGYVTYCLFPSLFRQDSIRNLPVDSVIAEYLCFHFRSWIGAFIILVVGLLGALSIRSTPLLK
jgi:hypothetical protein